MDSDRITLIDCTDTAAECDDWAKHKADRFFFKIDHEVHFAVGPVTIVFDEFSMEGEILTSRTDGDETKVEVRT